MDQEQFDKLLKPFPREAYNIDTSRGFKLTGVRIAYIIERLSQVFGPLGVGWRFAYGPFEEVGKEITVELVFQYMIGEGGTWPYNWDNERSCFVPTIELAKASQEHSERDFSRAVWSQPIQSTGGNRSGSGGVPVSDARKSAVSDALGKSASRLGVASDAYKGQLSIDGEKVTVASEEVGQLAEDMHRAAVQSLGFMLTANPEKYDAVRASNSFAESYHSDLLASLAKKIAAAKQSEFIGENLAKIVNDKAKTDIQSLSGRQVLFLNDVVGHMASHEVKWKDVLKMTGAWDGIESFGELLERLSANEQSAG